VLGKLIETFLREDIDEVFKNGGKVVFWMGGSAGA